MVHDRPAVDVFDDRRIAACVLEREMDVGLVPVRLDRDRLDFHEDLQRFGDACRVV